MTPVKKTHIAPERYDWVKIVQAVAISLMTLMTAYLSFNANEAALRRAETLAKVEKIETISKDTHLLVNSAMGAVLETNAALAERVANLTKDPTDLEIATAARKASNIHHSIEKEANNYRRQ